MFRSKKMYGYQIKSDRIWLPLLSETIPVPYYALAVWMLKRKDAHALANFVVGRCMQALPGGLLVANDLLMHHSVHVHLFDMPPVKTTKVP